MADAVVCGGNSAMKLERCGQKQRRAAFKKERRKRKRQALAKLRDSEMQQKHGATQISENDYDDDDDEEQERQAEEERQRLHQEWMQREEEAQEQFRLKMERVEMARKKQEEEERRIKEEWEEQQRKEQEEREQREQEKMDREEAVQKMLDQAESQLENTGPWKNPEAPEDYGTEKDRANCPFFLKTGACRFGDRCSRMHVRPPSSTTLMIRGMFVTFSMEQSQRDDYDTDASLEFSEDDLHQNFLEFYEDVLPEFKSVGKVVQFKVSCNFEPHLRGNVYVQYDTEIECKEAFITFNGRWYAGRQLQCEFSPVTRWKTAICGLFDRKKCPKGKHCNFLHVYRNPSREFWDADRDLSPDRGGAVTGPYSERRDWSYRNHKQLGSKGEKAENNSGRSPANSPENLDKTEKHSDSSSTHHHRKHSRKSKKRKSKKKKKKSENKTETPGRGISPLEPDLSQHLPQEAQEGLTEK
ncbi:hypothetical protein AGOR_G00062950 [Albula goreensis]|uniref:Uncharacterized protein n=1 Tax=Albula goreensis TaxID=1534307 RepID=A0A8T3DR39_9TELE|nr:hypothetical protein AGOR_G00062950 [Albula goreensis]